MQMNFSICINSCIIILFFQITGIAEREKLTLDNNSKSTSEAKSIQQSINSPAGILDDENKQLLNIEPREKEYYIQHNDSLEATTNNNTYNADDNYGEKNSISERNNNRSREYAGGDDEFFSNINGKQRVNSRKYPDGNEEKSGSSMDRPKSFRKLSYKLNGSSQKRSKGETIVYRFSYQIRKINFIRISK